MLTIAQLDAHLEKTQAIRNHLTALNLDDHTTKAYMQVIATMLTLELGSEQQEQAVKNLLEGMSEL